MIENENRKLISGSCPAHYAEVIFSEYYEIKSRILRMLEENPYFFNGMGPVVQYHNDFETIKKFLEGKEVRFEMNVKFYPHFKCNREDEETILKANIDSILQIFTRYISDKVVYYERDSHNFWICRLNNKHILISIDIDLHGYIVLTVKTFYFVMDNGRIKLHD